MHQTFYSLNIILCILSAIFPIFSSSSLFCSGSLLLHVSWGYFCITSSWCLHAVLDHWFLVSMFIYTLLLPGLIIFVFSIYCFVLLSCFLHHGVYAFHCDSPSTGLFWCRLSLLQSIGSLLDYYIFWSFAWSNSFIFSIKYFVLLLFSASFLSHL